MRAWWFPRRAREPQDRSGAAGSARAQARARPQSLYSPQYETIIAQGHARPTPSFGAPALVWHVAIWPRRWVEGADGAPEPCDPHDTATLKHVRAKENFEARRQHWIAQIKKFLAELQLKSCRGPAQSGAAPKELHLVPPHDLEWEPATSDPENFLRPVEILEQEITPFTLWWGEKSEIGEGRTANAIRVCVHPEVNADYACISFYMDIGQRWNAPHAKTADPSLGARRHRLMAAVDDIRLICEAQLEPVAPRGAAAVDLSALPEVLHSPDGRKYDELHEALKAARNLLYVDIWEAFSAEMGCRLEDIAKPRGEVFANIRGLIVSTRGMARNRPAYAPEEPETAAVGTVPFANFSASQSFNADGAEPNAVVKAFWPFMRRVTPRADFREFVACGVFNWRAIYITALGSSSQYLPGQEREPSRAEKEGQAAIRVPEHLLEKDEKGLAAATGPFDSLVQKRAGVRGGNNHPVRYLLLTKHEPHPRQVGRIAERINTMGTMRLYALKDWAAIRNADAYIRILGQELDQITKRWGSDRKLINKLGDLKMVRRAKDEIKRLTKDLGKAKTKAERHERLAAFVPRDRWSAHELRLLGKAMPTYTPGSPAPLVIRFLLRLRFFYSWRRYGELLKGMENDQVADIRHAALYEISNEVETDLIDISSKLDELGFGTIGGLHFRLNRSRYYVREFEILLKTLRINNIQSWISYEQFVRRGLAPAFGYMASVGKRLRAVRARLLTTTETIETSALVGQSAATRHNTAVLRRTTTLAIIILLIFLASTSDVRSAAYHVGLFAYSRLPAWVTAWMTSWIDETLSLLQ